MCTSSPSAPTAQPATVEKPASAQAYRFDLFPTYEILRDASAVRDSLFAGDPLCDAIRATIDSAILQKYTLPDWSDTNEIETALYDLGVAQDLCFRGSLFTSPIACAMRAEVTARLSAKYGVTGECPGASLSPEPRPSEGIGPAQTLDPSLSRPLSGPAQSYGASASLPAAALVASPSNVLPAVEGATAAKTTPVTGETLIKVTGDGGGTWTGTLAEFEDANSDMSPEALANIREELTALGASIVGGGAAPVFTIKLAGEAR